MGATPTHAGVQKVSQVRPYASTNSRELFAESWTIYANPEYGKGVLRKLPDEIHDYNDEIFSKGDAMSYGEPQCMRRRCKHFQGWGDGGEEILGEQDSGIGPTICPAYPKGIPERIAIDGDLHLTVQPDQVGVLIYEEGESEFLP